jgi:formylglycine-generating enzyme required for sulfatase activity
MQTAFWVLLLSPAPARAAGPMPLVAVTVQERRPGLEPALRSELLASKRFRLVPAARVEEHLRTTTGACTKPACLLQLGQALRADRVLTLRMRRKGRRCTLIGTLFHVVRRLVVRGGTACGRCTRKALGAGMKTVVAKLTCTWNTNDPGPMVLIPACKFVRGIAEKDRPWTCCRKMGRPTNDGPTRRIHLDWYYIDKHEVTVAQYRRCVKAGACTRPPKGKWCNYNHPDREDHPVNQVTWYQARAYCAWAGKRLPTEAEWENAARGTGARRYPWGSAPPSCKRVIMAYNPKRYRPPEPAPKVGPGCGRGTTWPVGSRAPAGDSPYGLQDMAGNVKEWVWDWYHERYYRRSPTRNPRGPSRGKWKVVRGGSYTYDGGAIDSNGPGFWFLTTSRGSNEPDRDVGVDMGFRCAMTP